MSLDHHINENKSINSQIQSINFEQNQSMQNASKLSQTVKLPPADQLLQQKKKQNQLVADTCMKIAQNVIFCASRFNPMEQNKVMAKAVLAAMGLSESIGDTSPAAAEKLYKKMNKAV